MARFHDGRLGSIASIGDWTHWRYFDLEASAEDIMSDGFFSRANIDRVFIRQYDLIDIECVDGYFRARVYDLERGTNNPMLMKISQIFDSPKPVMAGRRKAA